MRGRRASQAACADAPRMHAQGMPTPPDSVVDDASQAPTEENRGGGECGWGGTGRDSGELRQKPDGGGLGWCVLCLPRPLCALPSGPLRGCGSSGRSQPRAHGGTRP